MTIDELHKETQDWIRKIDNKLSSLEIKHTEHSVRLGNVEKVTEMISELTITTNELAVNMAHMFDEQKAQGERLKALEAQPKKHWDTLITAVISSIVGIVIGAIITFAK